MAAKKYRYEGDQSWILNTPSGLTKVEPGTVLSDFKHNVAGELAWYLAEQPDWVPNAQTKPTPKGGKS